MIAEIYCENWEISSDTVVWLVCKHEFKCFKPAKVKVSYLIIKLVGYGAFWVVGEFQALRLLLSSTASVLRQEYRLLTVCIFSSSLEWCKVWCVITVASAYLGYGIILRCVIMVSIMWLSKSLYFDYDVFDIVNHTSSSNFRNWKYLFFVTGQKF